MLKKFLIGTVAALVLLVGVSASAATDFGPSTLKVGSKGEYVKAVQTLVGVKADGIFGPMTAAKVKVWQAANGLTADGLFGKMSMAKANGAIVITPNTPATSTTVVTGGAGDLTINSSSKGVENTVKEGDEEKVLAFKVEAEDSDIQITNAKVKLLNDSGAGSEKLADYVDEVKVYLGSKEVASLDASDFSRESGAPDEFTKSISLKNAVVKEGNSDYLYVAVVATDDIDSDDKTAEWTVSVESVRFTDGTGAIMTDNSMDTDSEEFGFKLSSADDSLKIKSSSSNPDDVTVKVDEDDTTDDVLALAFKLEVDEDSSDMDLQSIKVTADTSLSFASASVAEKIIDSVVLKIAGEEFDAEDIKDSNVSAGTITYTFDIDGDVTIDSGDIEDAKVYVTFYKQGDLTGTPNYGNGVNVKFAVASAGIKAEVDGDSVDSGDITGSQSGALLTLNSVAATVDSMKWASIPSTGTIIDFLFTVKAEDEDFEVLSASIDDDTAGNATISGPVLTKSTGDATAISGGFRVNEGDTATFRVRYTLTGANGAWAEITMNSVAGQTVSDDKEVSPTATISL